MARALTVKHKTARTTSDEGILLWDATKLSETVRHGVKYSLFRKLAAPIPFSSLDWSTILQLSERTMQRYELQKKTFDPIYSDKILQVAILYKTGIDVFGDKANFDAWLETRNIALGGISPKSLLDNTFGINLVKDELIRIENGVLA
jgi:putative toxin-antitoxin system antitoxin component (TIGR02293 family)